MACDAQLRTGSGSVRMALQEEPKRLDDRREIATKVQRARVRDAQPWIRICGRWRQAFPVDAVRNARDGQVGIPRGQRLGVLHSVGDDPVGSPEGDAFQTGDQGLSQASVSPRV